MDEEIKRKWLTALRSGDYRQAWRSLRTDEHKFCCLGVLCDLIDPSGWTTEYGSWSFGQYGSFPPSRILEAAGVQTDDDSTHPFWKLADMNDKRRPFSEIADYIEQKF